MGLLPWFFLALTVLAFLQSRYAKTHKGALLYLWFGKIFLGLCIFYKGAFYIAITLWLLSSVSMWIVWFILTSFHPWRMDASYHELMQPKKKLWSFFLTLKALAGIILCLSSIAHMLYYSSSIIVVQDKNPNALPASWDMHIHYWKVFSHMAHQEYALVFFLLGIGAMIILVCGSLGTKILLLKKDIS